MSAQHYLTTLKDQADSLTRNSFDGTIQTYRELLDQAEEWIKEFRQYGVTGQDRDFRDAIDANRAALSLFERTQGPLLRRKWNELV